MKIITLKYDTQQCMLCPFFGLTILLNENTYDNYKNILHINFNFLPFKAINDARMMPL